MQAYKRSFREVSFSLLISAISDLGHFTSLQETNFDYSVVVTVDG